MVDSTRLRIFLQDHLAAATAGLELARRTRGSNRGTDYGEPLARLADEIEADRGALEAMLVDLGFGPDRPKNLGAWAGEKLCRLKLNGQLKGYSPLSRVIELEGLTVGIGAKLSLWRILTEVAAEEPRLDVDHLHRLIERAEKQRRTLEDLRTRAAREALLPT